MLRLSTVHASSDNSNMCLPERFQRPCRNGDVTASRAGIPCPARLNRLTSSSTCSFPSTPKCDGTLRRSTAIPRSYTQFAAVKKASKISLFTKRGSLDPNFRKRSVCWQSESIVMRLSASESSHATRKASCRARNSASAANFVPYGRVLKVTRSFQRLEKGLRYLIADAQSRLAPLVGGNLCTDTSTHFKRRRSIMPCFYIVYPYRIADGLSWMMAVSGKGYSDYRASWVFAVRLRRDCSATRSTRINTNSPSIQRHLPEVPSMLRCVRHTPYV
jgi:hypothetical protein